MNLQHPAPDPDVPGGYMTLRKRYSRACPPTAMAVAPGTLPRSPWRPW